MNGFNMRSIAFAACAALLLALASFLPARAQATWSEYQSEEGGFTVELPDSAQIQPEMPLLIKLGDTILLCSAWAVPFEDPAADNSLFLALYADFPQEYFAPDPGKGANIIVDSMFAKMFFRPGIKSIHSENHQRDGYLNRNYSLYNAETKELIQLRCYVIGRRFYALEAVSRRQNDDAFRFVESFKLLKKE